MKFRAYDKLWTFLALLVVVAGVGACAPTPAATPVSEPTTAVSASPVPEATATPPPPTATTPPKEQVFIFGLGTDVKNIDPAVATDAPSGHMIVPAYEALVAYSPASAELVPELATEWAKAEDGLSYTFTLRQGVTFHDGTPFNATVVKKSLERYLSIGFGRSALLAALDSVEVLGDYTVRLNLKNPDTTFLHALSTAYIISPTAIEMHEKDGDLAQEWLSENEAGTGPYMLESFIRGQRFAFTRYPNYWRGWDGPHLDKIVFQLILEPTTQRLMLEKGDIHYADLLSPDDANELKDNPDIEVIANEAAMVLYAAMNTAKGPLSDKNLRMTLTYAFDYTTYIERVMKGWSKPLPGPLPKFFLEHDPTIQPYEQDLAKAKEYLAQSQYAKGGIKLRYTYWEGGDRYQQMGLILRDTLEELGIELEIAPLPWATLTQLSITPEERPDMFVYAYTAQTASPYSWFELMYKCGSQHWANFGYCNPRVDELIEKGKILDGPEAVTLWREVQSLILADDPQLFVEQRIVWHPIRAEVEGAVWGPMEAQDPFWYDMYFSR